MEYGSLVLDNGEEILFKSQTEITCDNSPVQASLDSSMKKVKVNLLKEATKIGTFVSSFRESFLAASNDDSLAETEIEIGVDFDSSLGCAFISSSVNCKFKIKMKWEKQK